MDDCLTAVRVPAEDNVGLHCTFREFCLERDGEGNIIGLGIGAFRIDSDGLSVNWLEFCGSTAEERFVYMCYSIRNSLSVKPIHRVGIFKVEDIEDIGSEYRPTHIEHDPIRTGKINLCHSLVKGLREDEEQTLHDLTVVVNLHEYSFDAPSSKLMTQCLSIA